MIISVPYEIEFNLTDKHIEPAARELHDKTARGNPRRPRRFEDLTREQYDDYMIMAQWAIEGFLKGLPHRGEA